MFNGTAVEWFSKRQNIVTLSTAEAEYVAAAEGVRKAVITAGLMKRLNLIKGPIDLSSPTGPFLSRKILRKI